MRIWVDGQCFQTASSARGIGRYVADLLATLSEKNSKVELLIGLNASMAEEVLSARNFIARYIPRATVVTWYGSSRVGENVDGFNGLRMLDDAVLAAHINSLNPDVALSPSGFEGINNVAHPFLNRAGISCPTAAIFHDAIPFRFADQYLPNDLESRAYMRRLFAHKSFDLLLCNSEFTKSEAESILSHPNAVSISAGLSSNFVRAMNSATSVDVQRYGKYILYVGGIDWRKNVSLLVSAFRLLPELFKQQMKVVLAGDHDPATLQPIKDQWIGAGNPPANFLSTGWISDEELVALYKNATVAVQPSFMEGFGLSALEAMAAGTIFLASRGGAVEEIVNNDRLLFDPYSPHDLSTRIVDSVQNEEFREEAIQYGLRRSAEFSWAKTADIAWTALSKLKKERGKAAPANGSYALLAEKQKNRRFLMDVTSTVQSPVVSGIQRVIHNLSNAIVADKKLNDSHEVILSYCDGPDGWYRVQSANRTSLLRDPSLRILPQAGDTILMLDSSWTFIEGQKRYLMDALLQGSEVVTGIHDIGPLRSSGLCDAGIPIAFAEWFKFILSYSTGIICVSKAVADEVYQLIESIQLPRPMKIGFLRLGANFFDAASDKLDIAWNKKRPTFLMVGTLEPRKGHQIALDAFDELWRDGVDADLIIVGSDGWETRLLRERIEYHPEAGRRLHRFSKLPDAALRYLYEQADVLLTTSHAEGFGLPIVEAGKFNTPVIASDIPVFREVSQGAPWSAFFEKGNSKSLAEVVRKVIQDLPEILEGCKAKSNPWVNWDQSARDVANVTINGDWYKTYTPAQISPMTRLSDIGDVLMHEEIQPEDRRHSLRYVEGPTLSDDGTEARYVIALKNLSSYVWSSRSKKGTGLDINLSYHVLDKSRNCIQYDNPRTRIPFVLVPNDEILMPIRISTDWLLRNGSSIDIELVQEGVAWWGNSLNLPLAQRLLAAEPADGVDETSLRSGGIKIEMVRGPFTSKDDGNTYYLFNLWNLSSSWLILDNENLELKSVIKSGDGSTDERGAWTLANFSRLPPQESALFAVLLSTIGQKGKNEIAQIVLRHVNSKDVLAEFSIDLASGKQIKTAPVQRPAETVISAPEKPAVAKAFSPDVKKHQILMSSSGDKRTLTRGWAAPEETHRWLEGRTGQVEVSIDEIGAPSIKLRSIAIDCITPAKLAGIQSVEVYLDAYLIGTIKPTSDFNPHRLDLAEEQVIERSNPRILEFRALHARHEDGGERSISIALRDIVLTYVEEVVSAEVPEKETAA